MNVPIKAITEMKISGVRCMTREACEPYIEGNFDWTLYPMEAGYRSSKLACGLLTAWRCAPEFREVETHQDCETFFFFEGSCLMLFCDLKDGVPAMDTAQIARIDAGTVIVIEPGKAHFVPVGITDRFRAVVFAPIQEAPRVALPETVRGIE